MDPAVVEAFAQVVAAFVAGGGAVVLGLMCFPVIRTAVAERIRHRTLRHADAADITAELAALRGEVYALRTELAQTSHAVAALNEQVTRQALPPGR